MAALSEVESCDQWTDPSTRLSGRRSRVVNRAAWGVTPRINFRAGSAK
jgi:hypothetical protein